MNITITLLRLVIVVLVCAVLINGLFFQKRMPTSRAYAWANKRVNIMKYKRVALVNHARMVYVGLTIKTPLSVSRDLLVN